MGPIVSALLVGRAHPAGHFVVDRVGVGDVDLVRAHAACRYKPLAFRRFLEIEPELYPFLFWDLHKRELLVPAETHACLLNNLFHVITEPLGD